MFEANSDSEILTMSKANQKFPYHIDEIPKFYHRIDPNENSIRSKLHEQARILFLERLSKETMGNEELEQLWALLEKNVSSFAENCNDQKIDYIEFKRIGQKLNDDSKLKKFFTATTYSKLLQNDAHGQISILTFFKYVMRKIWMQQARISISFWDTSGNGYLCEYDLENYIKELIPTLAKLNNMDKSYHPFYICVASRKFFFFLDPHKHNKIKILDILYSGFLDDLLELRNEDPISKPGESFNWFSPANTIRLYNAYIDLDENHNGMISKSEFMKFGNFNEVFVNQLFDVCITYNKEIDFKTFIDIILALENRKEVQSIYFFFTILDIDRKNYLDDFALRYFFKAIENQMKNQGQEPISFDDFSNEIYDMVRPSTPRRIYFEDLIASGHSDIIISILIDFNGFYAYENRDSNIRAKNNAAAAAAAAIPPPL